MLVGQANSLRVLEVNFQNDGVCYDLREAPVCYFVAVLTLIVVNRSSRKYDEKCISVCYSKLIIRLNYLTTYKIF